MAIWEEPFNGRTWKQMPGGGPDEKKMNFALFRRGKLTLVDLEKWEDGETASARSMRKGIALGKAMRRLATLRAAAARREQEELQEALEEHIAAKERFADLAKRYAAQLES